MASSGRPTLPEDYDKQSGVTEANHAAASAVPNDSAGDAASTPPDAQESDGSQARAASAIRRFEWRPAQLFVRHGWALLVPVVVTQLVGIAIRLRAYGRTARRCASCWRTRCRA